MVAEGPLQISVLLEAWGNGDEEAINGLMTLTYPEVRRIARSHLSRRPAGHSLESAALANEVYLKLLRTNRLRCENRSHFLALCSQMIRRILVDYARNRGYAKRGGEFVRVPLGDDVAADKPVQFGVLALDRALESLAKFDPRKSRVVELRYFGGLNIEGVAEVLKISRETAKRDWKVAKAWLRRELGQGAASTTRELTGAVRSSPPCPSATVK
jgi:RNA polymerase sigma factor (TIGR02999 family)